VVFDKETNFCILGIIDGVRQGPEWTAKDEYACGACPQQISSNSVQSKKAKLTVE